jgi:hypothetical protein
MMLGWVGVKIGVKAEVKLSGFTYTVWPKAGGSVTEHFEVNRLLDVSRVKSVDVVYLG